MKRSRHKFPGACLVFLISVFCGTTLGFQTPGSVYDVDKALCDLAKKSELIVSGRISEAIWVIDPVEREKEYSRWNELVEKNPDKIDLAEAPKASKYVTGYLYEVELEEVLFSKGKSKPGGTIFVFVKGYPILMHGSIPYLLTNSNYMLHLLKTIDVDFGPDARTMKPGGSSENEILVKKNPSYVIVPGIFRLPPLTAENTELVDKARYSVKNRKTCASF